MLLLLTQSTGLDTSSTRCLATVRLTIAVFTCLIGWHVSLFSESAKKTELVARATTSMARTIER